jgi:uncharacterized protein
MLKTASAMPALKGSAMQESKRVVLWFLGITVVISWPLFLSSLWYPQFAPVAWTLAMFAPGIAAIVANRLIAGESVGALRLGRLGPKRYYLWALLTPPALSVVALFFTVLLGAGELDLTFSTVRAALPEGVEQGPIPLGLIVVVQALVAILLGSLINTIPAMGEELGWRGFLLPRLMYLGKWRAIVLSNVIWGLWHAPAILQGHNYPETPVLGVFLMVGFCLLIGIFLSWVYLATRSPWAPALGHGALNASAALPLLFLRPGVNITFGGTLASLSGWVGMILFVLWLVATRRLDLTEEVSSSEG